MVMATPRKPYLEVEQSVKLGQILTAVNGGNRRKKFRKYKRKSKKSKTVETKPPTTPDVRSSQKENPVEMQQPTAPISSPQLSTEIRLAALKALLLQAKDRETSSKPEELPGPKSAIVKSRFTRLQPDFLEDIARKRIASPELSIAAVDDYWGILNYEKRSEKIDMESIDLFLFGDTRG